MVGRYKQYFIVILLVLVLDRITKDFVLAYLDTKLSFGLVNFYLVMNDGIAFGFLNQFAPVLVYLIAIIVIVLLAYTRKVEDSQLIPYGFVIGGAIGNLIDRFIFGAVVDFIQIPFFSVFNVADMAITFGIIWLLYRQIKVDK